MENPLANCEVTMQSPEDKFLGTVLVTGGAGIVGSYVVEDLVKHQACGQVIATYHSKKAHQHSCPGVEYHVCDITNPTELRRLLDATRPAVVIHTVSPGPFAPSEVQHRVNYTATKELVEQVKAHPTVQALVYTSSVQAVVLRPGRSSEAQTEADAILNTLDSGTAISSYGSTKGAADALVLAANTGRYSPSASSSYKGRLLTTTLRVGGLYGERDLKTMWEMLKCVNTSATRFQIGPDKELFDWVYTTNVAQAHVLAAVALMDPAHPSRTNPTLKTDGEGFFVTDDSPMKFWEFSRKVWRYGGDKYLNSSDNPRIIQIPFWALMTPVSVGESLRKFLNSNSPEMKLSRHHLEVMRAGSRISSEKAKIRLGYKPVCDTEEGIKRSVAWFMQKENEVWFKS